MRRLPEGRPLGPQQMGWHLFTMLVVVKNYERINPTDIDICTSLDDNHLTIDLVNDAIDFLPRCEVEWSADCLEHTRRTLGKHQRKAHLQ